MASRNYSKSNIWNSGGGRGRGYSSGSHSSGFTMIPPFVRSPIRWTPRAKTSITPWTTAQSVAKRCKEIFPDAEYIIDTTACFGNETMAFRLEYDGDHVQVEACEWDLTHIIQLKDSIRQSPCKPISLTSKSSAKRLYELNPDLLKKTIVVCDPYWGGPDYKKQEVIKTLKLSDKELKDLVVDIPACLWVIKVPANFDRQHLLKEVASSGVSVQSYAHIGHRPNGSVAMIHMILKRAPERPIENEVPEGLEIEDNLEKPEEKEADNLKT